MDKRKDIYKNSEYKPGVYPSTRVREDGSTEVVEGSYTIYHDCGVISGLYGVNLATAEAHKRIYDYGFTDTEIERIRSGEAFSTDPEVDCKRLLIDFHGLDIYMLRETAALLRKILKLIDFPYDEIRAAELGSIDNYTKMIRAGAGYIRMPRNLELAIELRQLHLSENKEADKKLISAIIDKIRARINPTP